MKSSGPGPKTGKPEAENAKAKSDATQSSPPEASTTVTSLSIAAQAPSSHGKSFLDLPREIRDRIYEELLVNRFNKQDHADYHAIASGDHHSNRSNGYRQIALDKIDQKYALHPATLKGAPFVVQAQGLLLANKQINEEANEVLYGKNDWTVIIDGETSDRFWDCGDDQCSIPKPCIVSARNLVRIQHMTIMVHNERSHTDPQIEGRADITRAFLTHLVETLKDKNVNLKMLRVRYTNRFVGQTEDVRECLEGNSSMHPKSVLMRDIHGVTEQYFRNQPLSMFKYCDVLDPLTGLKGRVEDIDIFGDLPAAYIKKLTRIIQTKEPTAVVRKAREQADMLNAQAAEKREAIWASAAQRKVGKAKVEPVHAQLAGGMPRFSPLMLEHLISQPHPDGFVIVRASFPVEATNVGSGDVPPETVHIEFGPAGTASPSNGQGAFPSAFANSAPPPT